MLLGVDVIPSRNPSSVVKKPQFSKFGAVIFRQFEPMLARDVQRKL
jgi:hypothetical protein